MLIPLAAIGRSSDGEQTMLLGEMSQRCIKIAGLRLMARNIEEQPSQLQLLHHLAAVTWPHN